ncbi:EEF1A lysine methyltransferase 4-like [Salvia splendens]|uniref:EEF1A lysine methyltransferase 4-like n=1 Tax=Salvia splendens TaxID=180675 RepID=UPI001C25FFE3|nr:EEF1A lysine methyltransferase 4-like [Salvia splendens]
MTAGKSPAAGGSTTSTQAYGEAWYWDNRYSQDPSTFDWYQKYPSLGPLIRLYIPTHHHPILVVGCGNSGFSEEMADDGYNEVTNVDISRVVIEAMQAKYSDNPMLKYMVMDVRDMSAFDTRSFAAVIDKGTLDSLLCGYSSRQNAAKMLEEVWRVLEDKGVYILITYGSPVYRLPVLKELSWNIKLHVIGKLQSGNTSNLTRDLTTPIPLDANGGSTESVGINADVHYIYVCIKDESGKNKA